jgi:hypothetical protein
MTVKTRPSKQARHLTRGCSAARRERPHLINLAKHRQLVLGLLLQFRAVLAERLELVDELVHHVPQPLVRQLHVHVAVQDHLEQVAVVVPRIAPLLQRRLQPRVDVAEPHLLVQQAEDVVVLDVGGDHVDVRPVALLEQPVAQLLEAALVHLVDLVHVLLADVAVQVDDEGLHDVGHVGGGVEAGLRGLQVAEAVAELGAIVVGVVVPTAIVTAAIVSHGGGAGEGGAREGTGRVGEESRGRGGGGDGERQQHSVGGGGRQHHHDERAIRRSNPKMHRAPDSGAVAVGP